MSNSFEVGEVAIICNIIQAEFQYLNKTECVIVETMASQIGSLRRMDVVYLVHGEPRPSYFQLDAGNNTYTLVPRYLRKKPGKEDNTDQQCPNDQDTNINTPNEIGSWDNCIWRPNRI